MNNQRQILNQILLKMEVFDNIGKQKDTIKKLIHSDTLLTAKTTIIFKNPKIKKINITIDNLN